MPYLDTRQGRTTAVTLLLVGVLVLCVWYGSLEPSPENHDYPGSRQVAEEPEKWTGDRVSVAGQVVDKDPVEVELSTAGRDRPVVTVRGMGEVEVGRRVRIYGVLENPGTIDEMNSFYHPEGVRRYTWFISFIAGLWVLARIVRYWRFDLTDFFLQPGEEPLF